jgi:hypothetical protein
MKILIVLLSVIFAVANSQEANETNTNVTAETSNDPQALIHLPTLKNNTKQAVDKIVKFIAEKSGSHFESEADKTPVEVEKRHHHQFLNQQHKIHPFNIFGLHNHHEKLEEKIPECICQPNYSFPPVAVQSPSSIYRERDLLPTYEVVFPPSGNNLYSNAIESPILSQYYPPLDLSESSGNSNPGW